MFGFSVSFFSLYYKDIELYYISLNVNTIFHMLNTQSGQRHIPNIVYNNLLLRVSVHMITTFILVNKSTLDIHNDTNGCFLHFMLQYIKLMQNIVQHTQKVFSNFSIFLIFNFRYAIMTSCLKVNPVDRISLTMLKTKLFQLLENIA